MLESELLLEAYRRGIFPMAVDKRGDIGWFSPDPRAIIPLDDRFHVPHGLKRTLKKCLVEGEPPGEPKHGRSKQRGSPGLRRAEAASSAQAGGSPSKTNFLITFDADFEAVIRACAKRKEGTWISQEIIESYCELHRLGHAHSVEVRSGCHPELVEGSLSEAPEIPRQARNDRIGKPAGGLYGVHIGGAFFGESMFHRSTDASKVALVALVERLRAGGFVLLDTQWLTPHLAQFGAFEIPRREYLRRLEHALPLDCKF